MRVAALVFVLLLAASCAPRGFLTIDAEATGGDVTPIFVGTTRSYDADTGLYGAGRSETVRFSRFDVSVPPERETGDIPLPPRGAKADGQTDFVTVEAARFRSERDFSADLRRALQSPANPQREAVIFVHGFNTNFSEGLYRLAQLSHDLELPGAIVHYSWPSNANPLGYVHDRDSALFARDGLELLIRRVEAAGARKIYLVAHSMGSSLTMEAMRQIAIRGDRALLDRIGGVILISPDIDVDVFRAQAHAIGQLPQPFVIFGSERDRFLNLAGRLSGAPERLGNLKDVSRLADLEVTFYDVTMYADGSGHFNLGDSPALISLLGRIADVNQALSYDQTRRVGFLPAVVLTVRNATEIVLTPTLAGQ
jgi:esterase/lipase superfamily enzyme